MDAINDLDTVNVSVKDVGQLGFGNHSISNVASWGMDAGLDNVKSEGNEMTKNVYGINHRQTPLAIPQNRDHYGLTFFTRPQLNFRAPNLRQNRLFTKLLTEVELSTYRMIRNTLDPRLESAWGKGVADTEEVHCALVDPYQAFIPILTNSLISIAGWPDIRVDTYTSKAGPYKEEWSIVDGLAVNYSAYDLTATFRNSKGDPIGQMFYFWNHYGASVFEGVMSPYPDFIVNNEIDYNTRIYRLVLDPTKRYVQRIAACGAAFPYAAPYSSVFDYDSTKPYHDGNNEIQIPLRCMGAIYDDDILIRAFNTVVGYFNPDMRTRSVMDSPGGNVMKIPLEHLNIFNNRGYPRIDPNTRELEWYIQREYYDAKMEAYQEFDRRLNNVLGFSTMAQSNEEGGV
jgi:hypothetical protein